MQEIVVKIDGETNSQSAIGSQHLLHDKVRDLRWIRQSRGVDRSHFAIFGYSYKWL